MKQLKWRLILSLMLIFALGVTNQQVSGQILTTEGSTTVNVYPQNCGLSILGPDCICVNDDDDDTDEKWDFTIEPVTGENDTHILTITATADKSDATVTIQVISGQDKIDGFWINQDKSGSKINSFIVPAGTSVTKEFFIEGIKHSSNWKDVVIKVTLTAPEITIGGIKYEACSLDDAHELTVLQVDADVDSKNNNAFDFAGFDDDEDQIEIYDPGKYVVVNFANFDNDDVPDFADGFSLNNAPGSMDEFVNVASSLKFAPAQIELKPPFDPNTAKIKFEYLSSVPELGVGLELGGSGTQQDPHVISVKQAGMRIWNDPPDGRESGDPVTVRGSVYGDFIPNGVEFDWRYIVQESSLRTSKLWLEYVDFLTPTLTGEQKIKVTVTDPDSGCQCVDIVTVTLLTPECLAEVTNVTFITPAGNPVTSPDQTGAGQNEFTFNAATPGVLTINLEVEIAGISGHSGLEDMMRFEVSPIGNSTMTWASGNEDGTPTISGDTFTATVTFEGLPDNNSDFGLKWAKLKCLGATIAKEDYEVFFDRDATNNPGGSAENWFYYWNQDAGSPQTIWLDDVATRNLVAKVPAINLWTTYAGPRDTIHFSSSLRTLVGFSFNRRDGSNQTVTGIDLFRNVVIHEQRHVKQVEDNNTLPFYSDITGVSREAAASGWSWCAAGGNVAPDNASYNHFSPGADGKPGVAGVDDDGDTIVDEADEFLLGVGGDIDLDPDRDLLGTDPSGSDFDGGSDLEPQAQTAEINPENTYARKDWGDPGKNHKTIDKFDD